MVSEGDGAQLRESQQEPKQSSCCGGEGHHSWSDSPTFDFSSRP